MGASLLVFKNKSDVSGAMSEDDVRLVSVRAAGLSFGAFRPITTDRLSDWTRSKRTNGPSWRAAR
jgi:hypothetical protein